MKQIQLLRSLVIAALVALFGISAQAMSAEDTPLVVIRFNQQRVFYEQPLYTAVSRAVAVKPDVRFNLVSFVPSQGDKDRDEKLQATAAKHLNDVAASILKMGVAQEQMTLSTELSNGLPNDEVHIFVQ